MWGLETLFSAGHGSAGLMVRLNDSKGVFQPKMSFVLLKELKNHRAPAS